jgi:hypothetical protein
VILAASARAVDAQTGQANGSLAGTVRDSSAGVLPGATVVATNLETGFVANGTTEQDGTFDLALLPLGPYELLITAPGFGEYRQLGVTVGVSRTSRIEATLPVGQQSERVEVTADASSLTYGLTGVVGGLNARAVENAPITSRNVQNLALFAPGLVGRRDDEFGTTQFAFGGMARRGFTVDGADNTQRGGQLRLGIFSPEAIREIQVISNSYSAEYGRTIGGIINMVTRGGTNRLAGQVQVLTRQNAWMAKPPLATTKPTAEWNVFSGSVGGPIVTNRIFFFGSAEYQPIDAPRPITITTANAQALRLPPEELGTAPFAQRFRTALGRVDFRANERNFGFVRYGSFYTPSRFNTSGGLTIKSASNNFDDRQDSATAQWTTVVGSGLLNEFRFGDLRRKFFRPPVSGAVGPVVTIQNVANLSSNGSANQSYLERQHQFVNNLSWTTGRHSLKFGADISTIYIEQSDRLALTFLFSGLTGVSALQQYLNTINGAINPATGARFTYNQLTQSFGNNVAAHRTQSYNLFVNDDYRLAPAFTVSAGLRWEMLDYPTLSENAPLETSRSVRTDGNNFAPRLGASWQLGPKTVARGGYGIFYDTTNLRLLSQVMRNNGVAVQTIQIPGTDPLAPVFPNPLPNPTPSFAVRPSVSTFAADFKTAWAHQANGQIQRELARDLSVTAGYQFYAGRALPLVVDVNVGPPVRTLADGRPVYDRTLRPDTRFQQINELQAIGRSNYHGGFVSVDKRYAHGLQFSGSYTFGRARNNTDSASDTGAPVTDPSNPDFDWGTSSANQAHRFVLAAVWEPRAADGSTLGAILNGFRISPNVTITSGFPINVVQGQDLNGDLVNNDRPLFIARNSVTGPGFSEVNLRLSRDFRFGGRYLIEVIAEAENLFNETNAACGIGGCSGAVVNTFNAADFGRILATTNARQIQLGGRFRF